MSTPVSAIAQHGQFVSGSTAKDVSTLAFHEHKQFPLICDALSRKHAHHAILYTSLPESLLASFGQSLGHYLTKAHAPSDLRQADVFMLQQFFFEEKTALKFAQAIADHVDETDKSLVLLLKNTNYLPSILPAAAHTFAKALDRLLLNPKIRVLVIAEKQEFTAFSQYRDKDFCHVFINDLTDKEINCLLEEARNDLEKHHHVLIAEEIMWQAYHLAKRYYGTEKALTQAILLMDSSAARTSPIEKIEDRHQVTPVVTRSSLFEVLSAMTNIPASHLSPAKFKAHDFAHQLQEQIIGQSSGIRLIANELQRASARLRPKMAPFASFLFAGPAHSGKKTTAEGLAQQLFKQLQCFYSIKIHPQKHNALIDLRVKNGADQKFIPLMHVIQNVPFAVLLFEEIENASDNFLRDLHDVLTTGFLFDAKGRAFDFRQTIIIVTTTLASTTLNQFTKAEEGSEDNEPLDLMQLLAENKSFIETRDSVMPQELLDAIKPELTDALPALADSVTIIPFLSPTVTSIENILKTQLKNLGKRISAEYDIDLGYAQEVIRYLTTEARRDKQEANVQKALARLYFAVEQAVLSQADKGNGTQQLFLQLNETGQTLRCDWLVETSTRQHTS